MFQCLEHTLDLPKEQWRVPHRAHNKRNVAEYEGDLDIDPELLEALLRVAREVYRRASALASIKGS